MLGVLTLPFALSNYAMGKKVSTLSSRSSVFPYSYLFIEALGMLSIAKVPLSMSSCRCCAPKAVMPSVLESWGIHLCEHRVESGERRAVVGERKIGYSVVTFLEKEPLKPWKSRRLGSKFSLKLAKKTPKPWNIPS